VRADTEGSVASRGTIDDERASIEGVAIGSTTAIATFLLVLLTHYSWILALATSAWVMSSLLLRPHIIGVVYRRRAFMRPAIVGFLATVAMMTFVTAWAFLIVGRQVC
jgi:hypothetical protein